MPPVASARRASGNRARPLAGRQGMRTLAGLSKPVEKFERQPLVLGELGHGERGIGMRHDRPSREVCEKEMRGDVCETREREAAPVGTEADLMLKRC